MPRRPTSDNAVQAARFFLESFIIKTDSQDHILPKNDEFSPFSGFCRVYPQFSKKKDGGSATDGVSRAAFNKICLEYFEEGMRKPARNGNPGALQSNLAQQRRHFLRGRWVDPTDSEDRGYFDSLQSQLTPQQAVDAEKVLVDFSRWKPGPAGRGGERVCRKRDSISDGLSDEDDASEAEEMPSSKRRIVTNQPGHVQKRVSARSSAGGADKAARRLERVQGAGPGLLEMLCMVASSVEHVAPSHLESPTTSEGSDRSTEEEAAESSRDAPEASHERQHLQLPIAFTEALPASLVTGKLEVSMHKEPSSTAAAVPAAPALEVQAGGDKEAEHDDKVSVPIQEEASPAVVAHTHRSLADEGEALQHGHPAESSDARGSWDSASTHESDESLPRFSSSRSQQAYTADDDDKDAIAGGEASVAVAMTCAERMAASQHQAAGATARSSCARRMAAASTASSPPRHPLHDVPVLRSVEPAVPAPFANLFRSGHVVDEGMSRYPIGR